jgi:hypothetical protein
MDVGMANAAILDVDDDVVWTRIASLESMGA